MKRSVFGSINIDGVYRLPHLAREGETQEDRMIDVMLGRYPSCRVLLTLGEKGSMYGDARQRLWQQAFPVDARDTTGAGDAFIGYYVREILAGAAVAHAMRTASLAASITVSRIGAGRSIPYASEVARQAGSPFAGEGV